MGFEDRTKNYNFNKMDSSARTKVLVEEGKTEFATEAHKKLFGAIKEEKKEEIKKEILLPKEEANASIQEQIENLPSSNYIKSFKDATVPEQIEEEEEEEEEVALKDESVVNYTPIIETEVPKEISSQTIKKEIESLSKKPQKNYSFRIKLLAGVYCIVIALFGGWVITNSINISKLDQSMYQTQIETTEINNNISGVIKEIQKIDAVTGNEDEDSLLMQIVPEVIDITPEAITEPNKYEETSNWFDAICNWISGIFGG